MPKDPTPRRKARLGSVLAHRQPDLTLVLANIHDPHNVSAIYRSCDAFGVDKVHLYYTDTPFPVLGRKTSASARKWVESVRHRDRQELETSLRAQNMQILATTFTPTAKPLRTWDFTRPTAIIMGNEHSGVNEELISMADGELYIPMYGMIQSFNVSVASAIILSEACRQREAAGFTTTPAWSPTSWNAAWPCGWKNRLSRKMRKGGALPGAPFVHYSISSPSAGSPLPSACGLTTFWKRCPSQR